jgi:uncharacterized damage-inducible protein DinB
MTETSRIANLLKHAYDGTPWYGKPLLKLIADLSPKQAAATTIAGTHSIWQEVRHVIGWRQVACRLINGEPAAELTDSENWPQAGAISPADWQATLAELARTQVELQSAIAGLTDDRLREKAPGKPYSLYVLLHGVIQHDVYHAGQIAILRNLSQ